MSLSPVIFYKFIIKIIMSYFYNRSPLAKEYTLYTQQDLYNVSPCRTLKTSPISKQPTNYDFQHRRLSPSSFTLPLKTQQQNIIPQNTRKSPSYFRNKYNPFETNDSILMQILQPSKPKLPEKITSSLKNATLREFQDFVSLQIFKHVILNNNKYNPESKNHYTSIDITKYNLSQEQQNNIDLKKSVTIMLTHYLEFILTTIDFLKQQIDTYNEEDQKSTMRFGNPSLEQIQKDFLPPMQLNFVKTPSTEKQQQLPILITVQTQPTTQEPLQTVSQSPVKVQPPYLSSSPIQFTGEQSKINEERTQQLQERAKQHASQIGKSQPQNPLSFKSFNLQKKANQIRQDHGEKVKEVQEDEFSIVPFTSILSKLDSLVEVNKVKNQLKTETEGYLRLLFSQGISRAERAYQEKIKSEQMIEINISNGSNLSFGENKRNITLQEQYRSNQDYGFDPKMKEKINISSDEDF